MGEVQKHQDTKVFCGVSTDFVLRVCESLLASTNTDATVVVLGGVQLKLFIERHWAGFERYMMIGQDWTCGFNLLASDDDKPPEINIADSDLVVVFSSEFQLFTPHTTEKDHFLRDMLILTITANDWSNS